MHTITPRIIWPAPGLPALLEGSERRVEMIVGHATDPASLRAWALRLALRSRGRDELVPLELQQIESVEHSAAGPLTHEFMSLPEAGSLSVARVSVRVPQWLAPYAPRSALVLDIVSEDRVERAGAVGVLTTGSQLRLAFASDIHVAAAWDEVVEAVIRHAPDMHARLVHPESYFRRFIAEMNGLAARGELDLVVLGGDLVDHVARRSCGRHVPPASDTNVARFVEALSSLEVPAIAIPGNHDYRLQPWRARMPGLDAIGVPADRQRALLQAAGLWDRWPLRRSDFHALRTEDDAGQSALAPHLSLLAPATDFEVRARGMRLVFAASGRDVLPRWRQVERARRGLLLRAIPTSWDDPDCEGLSAPQVRRIAACVQTRQPAALFMHAPLLHVRPGMRVEDCAERVDPGDHDDEASQLRFERRLFATGLRCGVMFRNVGPLIRALASAPLPVAVFSGHVHHGTALALHKASLRVASRLFPVHGASDDLSRADVLLFTAPSLGHIRRPGGEVPGYLLARFDGGQLTTVAQPAMEPGIPEH